MSTTLLLFVVSAFWSSALGVEIDGIYYYLNGNTATVTNKGQYSSGSNENSYTNAYSGVVTIPSMVTYNGKNYTVTQIQNFAFSNCPDLKTVNIPSTVSNIAVTYKNGNYFSSCFSGCTSFKAFIISSDNPYYSAVGGVLFDKDKTTLIKCPQAKTGEYSVPSTIKKISEGAFYECTSLTSISLPNSITSIGQYAFYICSSLTNINIPTNLTELGSFVFSNCSSLSEIIIPIGIKIIPERAFQDCSSLTSVTIPEGVEEIGYSAFLGCSKLKEVVLPSTIKALGGYCFHACSNLSKINIPDGIITIPSYAFCYCPLTSIILPESIKKIEEYAFYDTKISTIKLPKTVGYIGHFAFCNEYSNNNNYNRNLYVYNSPSLITLYDTPFAYNSIQIHVYKPLENAFKNDIQWQKYAGKIIGDIPIDNPVTSITLDHSSLAIDSYTEGKLTATVKPDNASIGEVIYTSSNDDVVIIVDNTGKFMTMEPGNATITATALDGSGVKATCKIVVSDGIIKAESVTLNTTNATIKLGYTKKLTATVLPTNATLSYVIWNSSNPDVATVDENGVITGIGAGTATITATAADGNGVKATCKVTVTEDIKVASVTLNKKEVTIKAGNTQALTAIVSPSNATIKSVTWKSSNPKVATVNENGVVTGVSAGTATITATAADGSGVNATCKVTVTEDIKVASVTLNKKEVTIKAGSTQTLTATINPSNATIKNVTWKSSNPKVATVNEKGVVTGISAGTVTITATAADGSGVKGTCKVTVTEEIKVESVTLNKKEVTIKAGSTQTLTATISPSNATIKSLTWKSSNSKVATVDGNGVVTGISAGAATITATATDGSGIKATCKVNVIYNSIALTDASTSYSNDAEATVNPLEYTRIFNNTDWQALYIPFSMSYDDWKDYFDIARIDGIRLIDKNNDGIIDETILDIVKIEEGTITANTPYLIKPKETGEKTISISNTILYKSEENSLNFTTNIATFTFIGNYSTISASTLITNNYYTMDGGSLIITNGSNGLQPFRWYLKVESQGSAYNTTMPIAINVIGEENASTGIEESLIMNDKQHIYDLNGRVVNEKSLKSGIYIRNGKKVIIR